MVLAGTILGLALVWLVAPYEVMFGHGWRFVVGVVACAAGGRSVISRRWRATGNPKIFALALPFIAHVLHGGDDRLGGALLARHRGEMEKPGL